MGDTHSVGAVGNTVVMRKRDQSLLGRIEEEVLDDAKPLAGALRKCVVLGGQAGSAELREWATRELRGYQGADELPAYRVVPAAILIDATTMRAVIKGQRIAPSQLPEGVAEHVAEEVKLYSGVGELEALIGQCESGDGFARISLPMAPDVARLMNHEVGDPYQNITAVYWQVSGTSVRGIVDQVRTTLAALVGELRAGLPDDEALPSPALTTQAMNVAVRGWRPHVEVSSAQASTGGHSSVSAPRTPDAESPIWKRYRKLGAFVVGLATIGGAAVAYLEWAR